MPKPGFLPLLAWSFLQNHPVVATVPELALGRCVISSRERREFGIGTTRRADETALLPPLHRGTYLPR